MERLTKQSEWEEMPFSLSQGWEKGGGTSYLDSELTFPDKRHKLHFFEKCKVYLEPPGMDWLHFCSPEKTCKALNSRKV